MAFEITKWAIASLSIVGVMLNIRRRRECFYVWSITNFSWMVIDIHHHVWSQAALQFVYFVLAIWGIFEWKKRS